MLFEKHLSQRETNSSCFPTLQGVMDSFPQENPGGLVGTYATVITGLSDQFNMRFQDFVIIEKDIIFFLSPFSMDPDDAPYQLQLEFIGLQCDDVSRSKHEQLSLANFYCKLDKARFPRMWRLIKTMLSFFGSMYICEQTVFCYELEQEPLEVQTDRFPPT